ncbi:MAG: YdiU family protein [Planctomycetota bacterium]|nr:YdiU family protein [Planctomycetota bacterium]
MTYSSQLSTVGWNFEDTYCQLPDVLFGDARPVNFREPRVAVLNHALAAELGLSLDDLSDAAAAAVFAGQELPPGARPIAQAYAGHQFGGFTMLGDGRAILLGEQRTPSGQLVDIQFKGSGPTLYSRRGDGLAALGPMLREYIISEAMFGLGIPTTRSLAVVTTGETVQRETPLPGAILTRVAASHIRVGTFQFLAAQGDKANLRALADYTIARHEPEIAGSAQKYLDFVRAVIERQAALIAKWQLVGFIHGVMNTDNMAVSGETIDYGPCAFMDVYHAETVFSSIDHGGRYAYRNQPGIAQWNLARFAETLLPLLDADEDKAVELAMEALSDYAAIFDRHWLAGMRRKLGLTSEADDDRELIDELLEWMQTAEADFTNTFDDLTEREQPTDGPYVDERFQVWYSRWRDRLNRDGATTDSTRALMRSINPVVIPRNHRVEEALAAATEDGDLSVMHRHLEVLSSPFERNEASADYRTPPPPGQCYRTFCGT